MYIHAYLQRYERMFMHRCPVAVEEGWQTTAHRQLWPAGSCYKSSCHRARWPSLVNVLSRAAFLPQGRVEKLWHSPPHWNTCSLSLYWKCLPTPALRIKIKLLFPLPSRMWSFETEDSPISKYNVTALEYFTVKEMCLMPDLLVI